MEDEIPRAPFFDCEDIVPPGLYDGRGRRLDEVQTILGHMMRRGGIAPILPFFTLPQVVGAFKAYLDDHDIASLVNLLTPIIPDYISPKSLAEIGDLQKALTALFPVN